MLTLFKSFILSKIDYGVIIHSNAKERLLSKQNVIKNYVLRNPIASLQTEANIRIQVNKKTFLLLKRFVKIRANLKHLNFVIIRSQPYIIQTKVYNITISFRSGKNKLFFQNMFENIEENPTWKSLHINLNFKLLKIKAPRLKKNNFLRDPINSL